MTDKTMDNKNMMNHTANYNKIIDDTSHTRNTITRDKSMNESELFRRTKYMMQVPKLVFSSSKGSFLVIL